MTDVFISYSRKDKDFVQHLHEAIVAEGRETWVDWEGIPLTADWWAEIQEGIEAADTFVFVIGPDSAASKVCGQEVEHAKKHNKRIVPIVYQDVSPGDLPPILGKLNWIFCREGDDFDNAFKNLMTALDTDLDWVKAHTRLIQRAVEWNKQNHSDSYVLRGEDLDAAEQMLTQTEKEPRLTELQAQFIAVSRKSARRRRRNIFTGVTVALVVAIILAILAGWQSIVANNERDRATKAEATAVAERIEAERQATIAHSRQLAAQALNQLEDQPDLGMLLAVQANLITDTASAKGSLLTSVQHQPYLSKFLHGHNTDVNSVAFSPNGQTLATGDEGGNIILWDIQNGQPQYILSHSPDNEVRSVAFSPNGQVLASVASVAGPEVTIILWDLSSATPKESEPIGTFGWGNLVFSPDGQTVAFSGDDGIQLFDVATQQQLQTYPVDGGTSSVAFSPNGQTLAAGTGVTVDGQDFGSVYLFDINSTQPLAGPLVGHEGYVESLAFSPDNQILASAGRDNKIILWDADDGQPIGLPLSGHDGWILSLAFSPDGQMLASGSFDQSVILWDVPNRQQREYLQGHKFSVNSVAFSPDGTTLASGGDGGIVTLWDARSSLPLGEPLLDHIDTVNSVTFLDDQVLISGSHDGTTIKWELTAQPIRGDTLDYEADDMRRITISPDGQILALGTSNGIILWDLINEQMFSDPLGTDLAWELAFSPDSHTLAASSADNAITLWNTTTYEQHGQMLLAEGVQVTSLAFNPIEQTLASGDDKGIITLWDVATQQPLDTISIGRDSTVFSLAFSPDGQTLAAGDGAGNIRIWQVNPWYLLQELFEGHNFLVVGLAFSPDGQVLASIDEVEGYTVLWDVNTGQQFGKSLIGHKDGGWDLAFSPNGQILASSSYDTRIILWEISPSLWQVNACRRANRNLSWSEWNRFVGSETPFQRTCPDLPIPSSVIEAARDLARAGQIDEAIAQFEYLLTLDPSLTLDPQTEVERAIE